MPVLPREAGHQENMTDTTAVGQWYDANAEREHERLGQFSMEFALSMRAIQRCIDTIRQERYGGLSALLKILDLGGGTGRYCTLSRLPFYRRLTNNASRRPRQTRPQRLLHRPFPSGSRAREELRSLRERDFSCRKSSRRAARRAPRRSIQS